MALKQLDDSRAGQDERNNPSGAARDLYRQENDASKFNDIARNYDKTADATQENSNIANLKDREESSSEPTNFYRPSSSGKKEKVTFKSFFKKKGPMGLIIGLLLGGGAGFSMLLAPGIGIVHLKEVLTDDLNDQLSAMEFRSDHLMRTKLKNLQANGSICSNMVKIRCKFSTMSTRYLDKLEKAGFTFDRTDSKIPGRHSIANLKAPDGTPIDNPNTLMNRIREDPATRSALRKAYNPKFAGFSDAVSQKVFGKLKISKTANVSGDTDEARDKRFNEMTAGEAADTTGGKGYFTDENGNNYVKDTDGTIITESSNPDKFSEIVEENKAKTSAFLDDAKSKKVDGKASNGVFKAGLKGLMITGAADTACTIYNTARAVSAAAKGVRKLELAQFAMQFLNTADTIKAGDATPSPVEYIGNKLTATDTRKMIQDETALGSVTFDGNGQPTDDSFKEVENPFYGKNAFDSPGYAVAAYNDAPTLTSRSLQYTIGGGLTGSFDSVMNEVTAAIGGDRNSIRETCGVIQSWWVRGAGLIAGILSGAGSFGATTAVTVGASVALSYVAMPILKAFLTDTLAGEVVSANTKGVDAGDAIFSGFGAITGDVAMARGMKPATKSELQSYLALSNQVKSDYVAMETYEARNEPFNVMNQYSFLGSFARSVAPTVLQSEGSLSAAFLNVPTLIGSAATSLLPGVSAAQTFNPERFSKCHDEGYAQLGIDADIFCNVRYVLPSDELNMDTDAVVQYMVDNNHIDPESGKATSGNYTTWLDLCTERTAGWGETESDDGVTDSDIGLNCMNDGPKEGDPNMYKYFRVYTMDLGINQGMDDEEVVQTAATSPTSGGAGAVSSTGWAYPLEPDGIITSGYKTPDRPGHKGVDLAHPGGSAKTLGRPIFAVRDGVVTRAGTASGFGHWIIIQHTVDGQMFESVYGHMYADQLMVKTGDTVKAGQQIAKIGSDGESTGPHLHFEIWNGGRFGGTETDPTPILNAAKGN